MAESIYDRYLKGDSTMKKYVKIQSEKTINVTPGLQNRDVTNPDAHVADRLKIQPTWPKCVVTIHKGVAWYSSEIVDWPTVKALAKDKILTIGIDSDTPEDTPAVDAETLQAQMQEAGVDKRKRAKGINLETIAGE